MFMSLAGTLNAPIAIISLKLYSLYNVMTMTIMSHNDITGFEPVNTNRLTRGRRTFMTFKFTISLFNTCAGE